LLAVAAGEAFLADRPWHEIWWGCMHLDLASGWRLRIVIERDQLGVLLWAMAPDGRDWAYGCQRDDWTLGPDSRIVEPVGLLEPEQRQRLKRMLRMACCWPAPAIQPDQVFPFRSLEPTAGSHRGRPTHRPAFRASRGAPGRQSRTELS